MNAFPQELRYALRQLCKHPGYATVAILTLALGIGVNTAIFLLTCSILLKSLPIADPGRLIRYTLRKGDNEIGLSYANIRLWSSGSGSQAVYSRGAWVMPYYSAAASPKGFPSPWPLVRSSASLAFALG